MKLEKYFRKGKVYVWKERFAVIKSKKPMSGAFANIKDRNELTVVIDQTKIKNKDVIEIEKDWKILTFKMVLPFQLVGFMAKVSKALADEKVSIFAVSAFSTDHILVKEKDLAKAVKALKSLGLSVRLK